MHRRARAYLFPTADMWKAFIGRRGGATGRSALENPSGLWTWIRGASIKRQPDPRAVGARQVNDDRGGNDAFRPLCVLCSRRRDAGRRPGECRGENQIGGSRRRSYPSLGDGLDPRRQRPQSGDRAARRGADHRCARAAPARAVPEHPGQDPSASSLLRRAWTARDRLPPQLPRERQVLHRLFGAAARRRHPRPEALVVSHQHGLGDDRHEGQSQQSQLRASRRSSRRSTGRSSTTTATGSASGRTASSTCRPATAATPTTGASATT